MKFDQAYRPYAPRIGDLVFQSENPHLDVNHPEKIKHQVGAIESIVRPMHGALLQYEIDIKMADGQTVRGLSQEWKCFRHHVASTSLYAKEQIRVLQEMEASLEKQVPTETPRLERGGAHRAVSDAGQRHL